MILEAAKVTLRQSKRFRTVAHANDCIQDVLEGLCELHKNGVVHLDIKPENIFLNIGDRPSSIPVRDSACALRIPLAPERVATRVRQVWKLGDFDAHRMQGEPVGEYTPEYASRWPRPRGWAPRFSYIRRWTSSHSGWWRSSCCAEPCATSPHTSSAAGGGTQHAEQRRPEAILSTAIEPLPCCSSRCCGRCSRSPGRRDSAAKLKKAGVLTETRSLPAQSRCALSPPMRASPIARITLRRSPRSANCPAGEGSAF